MLSAFPLPKGDLIFSFNAEMVAGDDFGDSATGPEEQRIKQNNIIGQEITLVLLCFVIGWKISPHFLGQLKVTPNPIRDQFFCVFPALAARF